MTWVAQSCHEVRQQDCVVSLSLLGDRGRSPRVSYAGSLERITVLG